MSYSIDNVTDKPKSKEERIKDYVRAMVAIEQAMEPYKEQRRDMRKNYVENGWLTKDEMKNVMKAYRLMKDQTDFSQLEQAYKTVTAP
jgi:hypothetical protein